MAKKDFSQALGAMLQPPTIEAQAPQKTINNKPARQTDRIPITALIQAETKKGLDVIAAKRGIKKKELIDYILTDYVKNNL